MCFTAVISGTVLRTGIGDNLPIHQDAHWCSSLQTYGANVDQIRAPIGAAVTPLEVEAALKSKNYKLITITHVDTSTGAIS